MLSLRIAVAASAVFAIAGTANVNLIELATHAVAVVLAISNTAGNAAVHKTFHIPLLFLYFSHFNKKYTHPD